MASVYSSGLSMLPAFVFRVCSDALARSCRSSDIQIQTELFSEDVAPPLMLKGNVIPVFLPSRDLPVLGSSRLGIVDAVETLTSTVAKGNGINLESVCAQLVG
jgi:hypothetical protein